MDQSKKTMRHFYCRDVLWETFEQMANDFDCSIDYLVNEAMRYYARSKNYQSAAGGAAGAPGANGPASGRGPQRPAPQSNPPPVSGAPAQQPARRPAAATSQAGYQPPPGGPPRPAPVSPPVPVAAPVSTSPGSTLFLVYNGQRYPVSKDQFIIGRGSKTSDLAIKDGNISRKHAAVIRRNGTFYIKDLGSTNGIDYKGMRIDNKRIDEGDVFHLCDYELRFTYRPE
jgi:pSer/pThr/pTyr-binding forkhead associated (FHA) protein